MSKSIFGAADFDEWYPDLDADMLSSGRPSHSFE